MHITTTARHCTLDEKVREHAQKRLEKLSRFARDITEVHLTVTAEKFWSVAEITLRLRGPDLVSREQADRVMTAIDLAADHMEKQLRKLRERRLARRKGDRRRTATGMEGTGDSGPGVAPEDEGREVQGSGWVED